MAPDFSGRLEPRKLLAKKRGWCMPSVRHEFIELSIAITGCQETDVSCGYNTRPFDKERLVNVAIYLRVSTTDPCTFIASSPTEYSFATPLGCGSCRSRRPPTTT